MTFSLPETYPITDARLSGLSHAEQARRLIAGGARLIQIREKDAPSGEFYESVVKVIGVARVHGVKTIVNDRVDIAIAAGADGVHLGQDDLPPAEARKLLGSGAVIGFSTHSVEQAIEAIKLPIDYIAVGPVFSTSTKSNPDPKVGLDGVRAVRSAIGDFPLVAIGGISLASAPSVLEAGADALAVIGDLVGNTSMITERMRDYLKL